MPFLEARNISKSFQRGRVIRNVLKDVHLDVEESEFVSIVGATGAGKSTLLSILAGLTMPSEGTVLIDGKPLCGIYPRASFVFQNYSLLPWYSAIENVRLGAQSAFPEWSMDRQVDQARRYLDMVGLGAALHKRPAQLSGGMRQRVAIARAFATEPALLFLDEPFSALDALTRSNLQRELIHLSAKSAQAATIVMITNSLDEALLTSHRIVPMTAGPGAKLGTPLVIDLPHPRSEAMLMHEPAALRVRSGIVEQLAGFVQARRGAVPRMHSAATATGRAAEERV